jgi:hypothetical protein
VTARIPNPVGGIDIYSLPLNSKEGFILSRVDGASSVEDISMMVGIKLKDLLTILDRLADLGAVQLSWRAAKPLSSSKPASPQLTAEEPSRKGEAHPAAQRVLAAPLIPLYMESELDEVVELSEAQKKRILNGFYALEGKDYYELLGLDRNSDKKAIRGAYFELSRLFHPDAFFGKNLGSFQTKMESVFKRLTEAYETL